MDFSFIYDEVKELYSDFGRESIDPVVLVKSQCCSTFFGIPSMRQAIREIEVNIAYRWFLVMECTNRFPLFYLRKELFQTF